MANETKKKKKNDFVDKKIKVNALKNKTNCEEIIIIDAEEYKTRYQEYHDSLIKHRTDTPLCHQHHDWLLEEATKNFFYSRIYDNIRNKVLKHEFPCSLDEQGLIAISSRIDGYGEIITVNAVGEHIIKDSNPNITDSWDIKYLVANTSQRWETNGFKENFYFPYFWSPKPFDFTGPTYVNCWRMGNSTPLWYTKRIDDMIDFDIAHPEGYVLVSNSAISDFILYCQKRGFDMKKTNAKVVINLEPWYKRLFQREQEMLYIELPEISSEFYRKGNPDNLMNPFIMAPIQTGDILRCMSNGRFAAVINLSMTKTRKT